MTKFRLLLSLLLLFGYPAFSQEVNFSGKITKPVGETVRISWSNQAMDGERTSQEAKLGADGSFQMKFNLETARPVVFFHGEERSTLFFHPGDQVKLTLSTDQFDETLKLTGTTPGAADSRFLAAWYLRFEDNPSMRISNQKIKDLEGEAYLEWRNSLWKKQITFLDSFHKKIPLSAPLKQFVSWNADYNRRSDLLVYPDYHQYLTTGETQTPIAGPTLKYVLNLPLIEDKAVNNSSYGSYLDNLIGQTIRMDEQEETTDLEVFFRRKLDKIQALVPEGDSKKLIEALTFSNICEESLIRPFEVEIQAFIAEENGSGYGEAVKKIHAEMDLLSPGKPAPAFTLQDLTGQQVSLKDFQGKVVYLDFWASWCGPCRAEMPASHALQKQFEGKEVVFVYISIDDAEKDWRKGMEELELTGTLLWAKGFNHEVPVSYHINAIPHYVLIDRTGRLVAYQALRPSSGEKVAAQIQEALNKPFKGGISN